MYTNVNLAAPIGALALLASGFVLLTAGLTFAVSLVMKKSRLKKFSLVAMVLVAVCYLALMLVFSFASRERVLARGEEKHFCELDCHLAYSVTDVREAKVLGTAPDQITATGMFRVITIRTRFDESTISRARGDRLLYPNSRVVTISDQDGKKYFPATSAQALLDKSHAAGTAFTIPLRPTETYSTTLVFDLPADIKSPTLLIQEGESLTHFVIGHENSFLHKKTRFQI
jgi:hypothetical protein